MLEVLIDPLKLEAYDVTADELINVVTRNNLLIAAGALHSEAGKFSVKIPGLFQKPEDVFSLPIKSVNGTVVTLQDVAQIRRALALTPAERIGAVAHTERMLARVRGRAAS